VRDDLARVYLGRRVLYPVSELQRWLDKNSVRMDLKREERDDDAWRQPRARDETRPRAAARAQT
jgi:hypothetical protein